MLLSFYYNALEKHIIIEVFVFTRNNLMFKSRKDNSSITIIFFCIKELNLMKNKGYGSYIIIMRIKDVLEMIWEG